MYELTYKYNMFISEVPGIQLGSSCCRIINVLHNKLSYNRAIKYFFNKNIIMMNVMVSYAAIKEKSLALLWFFHAP